MKVAVTYGEGKIFQHFGHCETFKVYEVEDGEIRSSEMITADEGGHSMLAALLGKNKVDALICGGIGGGAIAALGELGIAVYGGVTGDADAAAERLARGTLEYDPDVRCSHHDSHHENGDRCHGPNGCAHRG